MKTVRVTNYDRKGQGKKGHYIRNMASETHDFHHECQTCNHIQMDRTHEL